MKTLDLRPWCKHCGKLIRGKVKEDYFANHPPYCSFHCQESARMARMLRDVRLVTRGRGGPA